MDKDRSPIQLEKLFWGRQPHTAAASGGWDDGGDFRRIHWYLIKSNEQ
jgi:hypothetical protein